MLSSFQLGTLTSSRLTGRGALLFHSGVERVISLTATTTEVLHCSLSQARFFAKIFRGRILPCLLAAQWPQQSGFTIKMSATDRILALRVVVERKCKFLQKLHAAYADLRKAFDSVRRASLWTIPRSRGVPSNLVNLIYEQYFNTSSAVRCGCGISDFFQLILKSVRVAYGTKPI